MSEQVLVGKNGWLFLQNDTNRVLHQITGKTPLNHQEIARWDRELQDRQEHAAAHGYKYMYLLIPNKHCVYNEHLPDRFKLSENRPAVQIKNIGAPVYYAREDLIEYKKNYDVFHKTDTHWNAVGASVVFNKISEMLSIGATIPMEVSQVTMLGDLGSKLTPPVWSTSFTVALPEPGKIEFSNKVNNIGGFLAISGPKKNLPVAVVFGDSFIRSRILYLAQLFSKVYFFHVPLFDKKLIETIKPDVVLSENVERFVHAAPSGTQSYLKFLLSKLESLRNTTAAAIRAANFENFEKLLPPDELEPVVCLRDQWMRLQGIEMSSRFSDIETMDAEKCMEVFIIASSENTEIAEFYSTLFRRLMHLKKTDVAAVVMKKLLEFDAASPEALISLSHILVAQKKFQEAISYFKRALDRDPENVEYLNSLSKIYRMAGDFSNAELMADRSVQLNPANPQSFICLSFALITPGKLDKAIQCIQKALDLVPDNAEYLNHLGNVYRMAGDFANAERAANHAIRINTANPKSFFGLSHIFTDQKKFPEAIACLKKAIELDPGNAAYGNHMQNVCKMAEAAATAEEGPAGLDGAAT